MLYSSGDAAAVNWGLLNQTVAGEYSSVVKPFASRAITIKRPIYFRLSYEFDDRLNELAPQPECLSLRGVYYRWANEIPLSLTIVILVKVVINPF